MSISITRAVLMAAAPIPDADPRVIQQTAALFLVSRCGELWRVFDSPAAGSATRALPSPTSEHPTRLFVALARRSEVRAYHFADGASRDIDASTLQRQLDGTIELTAKRGMRCA